MKLFIYMDCALLSTPKHFFKPSAIFFLFIVTHFKGKNIEKIARKKMEQVFGWRRLFAQRKSTNKYIRIYFIRVDVARDGRVMSDPIQMHTMQSNRL